MSGKIKSGKMFEKKVWKNVCKKSLTKVWKMLEKKVWKNVWKKKKNLKKMSKSKSLKNIPLKSLKKSP